MIADDALSHRRASADDIDWLADTYVDCLQAAIIGARGYWDEDKERKQFLSQLRLADTTILVCAGHRAGFYTAWTQTDHLFLGTLCVAPEQQNRGIGARAMRDIARHCDPLPIRLNVLKSNPAARRFYERLGCRWLSSSEYHDHMEWSSESMQVK